MINFNLTKYGSKKIKNNMIKVNPNISTKPATCSRGCDDKSESKPKRHVSSNY
jgi:hypothetical protein